MKEAISKADFEARTGLKLHTNSWDVRKVVPLKEIVEIIDLHIMSEKYLQALLRNATLEGNPSIQPYKDAKIEHYRIDPGSLQIAQTFVERKKYERLIEKLSSLFLGFCVNQGFAKCIALVVIGKTASDEIVAAHYLPPIIEIHAARNCLIDGTHRNYITMAIGTTIESIVISGNIIQPPCEFGAWKNIKVVEQKPPREERFINLDPFYFRNLGFTGIDG